MCPPPPVVSDAGSGPFHSKGPWPAPALCRAELAAVEPTLAAASRFGRMAFTDALEDRPVEALAHAGIALELLTKGALIHTHPLLVVDAPGGKINVPGMVAAVNGGVLSSSGVRWRPRCGVNRDERRFLVGQSTRRL